MSLLPRPIFIVGPQRSGTTLLRLMLDSHPEIAIGPESGFMRAAEAIKQIPDWPAGEGWFEEYGLTEEALEKRIAEFYGQIFSAYALQQGKSRWGEKTPFHRFAVPDIARLFPDSQFIGVTRHPGAVLASRKRWHRYEPHRVVTDWVRSTEQMTDDEAALGGDRYRVVRYEDLVQAPEQTMATLLSYLDLPWSEAVLRHHEVQAAKGAPEVTNGGTRPGRPIHTERVDGWRHELAADEVDLLRREAGTTATTWGYDVVAA